MTKYITIDKLEFRARSGSGAKAYRQAVHQFPNGWKASVLQFGQDENDYEVACLHPVTGLTECTDFGAIQQHLNAMQVNFCLRDIAELDENGKLP